MKDRFLRARPSVIALTLLLLGTVALAPRTAADHESPSKRRLRHVVMFQFKASSSPAEIQGVVDAFRQLPRKISQVADFEYGTNNSPEQLTGGLTHVFLVTFRSEADRTAYLPHPAHLAFVEKLKPHLEKVTVIDYWASR